MYDPRIGDKQLTFGVSGKLYKSALVMYDHQTESLWSQILQHAITGPMTGTKLNMLPAYHTTWKDWSSRHPDTVVMSPQTGFQRNYGLNSYSQYWEAGRPSKYRTSPGFDEHSPIPLMAKVVGVQLETKEKAYPFSIFENKSGTIEDVLAGKKIVVHLDKPSENAYVTDEHGTPIPSVVMFWFTGTISIRARGWQSRANRAMTTPPEAIFSSGTFGRMSSVDKKVHEDREENKSEIPLGQNSAVQNGTN